METLVRRIDFSSARGENAREWLRREWLATNGLGGYASGQFRQRFLEISWIVNCGIARAVWPHGHAQSSRGIPAPAGRDDH